MIKYFNTDNIRILQEMGANVYVGTNFNAPGSITKSESKKFKEQLQHKGVVCYQIDFKRRIGSIRSNIHVIKQIRKIIVENKIDGLHVQSPLGGVLGRIAAHKMDVKVLYTAHGFQFFPGGPKKDWFLYYPVERLLSHWCDALVTINTDDFKAAQKFPTHTFYIPGVGTNIIKSQNRSVKEIQSLRKIYRKKLSIASDEFLILSVGELTVRKNHQTMIKALKQLNNPKIKYVIAGVGQEKENLINLINNLGLQNNVKLLGYVNKDVLDGLYYAADLNVFVSLREGLGFGGLDGVAHNLYIIGNANTGMKDYIINQNVGLMMNDPTDVNELAKLVKQAQKNEHSLRESEKAYIRKFDQQNINKLMKGIYQQILFS